VLKAVATNDNYFVKVRQVVLKALTRMEISIFNEYISHEMFLLKFFNGKNLDDGTGFYKTNNFDSNLLEYYMDKAVLKAISHCKEYKLKLTRNKEKELEF